MEFSRRDLLKVGIALTLWPAPPLKTNSISSAPSETPPPPRFAGKRRRRRCASWGSGPYADAMLVHGEPPEMEAGAFTIAVLPDTQYYSEQYPNTYLSQTQWVVENQQARNIACVLHLGDVTNHNRPEEWENAVYAMRQLDGKVPYFMVPGNHDYSENGKCIDRHCGLSEYFPISRMRDQATFGGVYDKEPHRVENSYHFFEAEGRKFLVLGLEFGPRKDVIRWANEVVSRHADRSVILITHAYTYFNQTRHNWKQHGTRQQWNPHSYGFAAASNGDVSDGEELWNELVSKHENFVLTLNGHVLGDGLGRVATATPGGRDVNQLLVNFQMRPRGGDGWLRLLEFRADGSTVQVYDYSPTRDQHNESKKNQFTMTIPSAPSAAIA